MAPPDSELLALVAADASPDGILVVDAAGTIRFASQSLCEMFRYRFEELVGVPYGRLVPEAVRDLHRHHHDNYLRHGGSRPMGAGMVLSGARSDGTHFPLEISLRSIESGGERLVVAAVRDMTERLAVQIELDEAQARLSLTEERERIARDLHDTVIQQLFGTGLALQSTASREADPQTAARIGEAVDQLDDIIRRIRTVIFGLHENTDPDAFRDRVHRLVAEAGRALGFSPTLMFDGPLDTVVSRDLAHHVLGVLRESLANVARHAGASRVDVHVRTDGATLEIEVRDNGRGVSADTAGAGGGRGLRNLRERASAAGGSSSVTSAPGGRGTLVRWCAPIGWHRLP